MSEDHRRPAAYAAERDRVLRRWIADVVYGASPRLRHDLDRSGLGRRGLRRVEDLARLPIRSLRELDRPERDVLEPTVSGIEAHARWAMSARLWFADALGRRDAFARTHLDPALAPVRWWTGDDPDPSASASGSPSAVRLRVAASAADLDRLASLGRRALDVVGVRSDDRIALVADRIATIAEEQLVLGALDAGIPLLRVGGAVEVDELGATVLAGSGRRLFELVRSGRVGADTALVVLDGPLTEDQRRLLASGSTSPSATSGRSTPGRRIGEWWAPPAVRAAWARCPGGTGFHTWPTTEFVEVLDDEGRPVPSGRLVWSAVGWAGSVWLRVDTGARGTWADGRCPACGRTTPRIEPA